MGVGEALVAAVDTVVYSVADVGRVDALAARQTVKRAVARRTRGAGHRWTAASVVASAAVASATAAGTHRVRKVGTVSPAVVSYCRQAFSAAAAGSVPFLPTHANARRLRSPLAFETRPINQPTMSRTTNIWPDVYNLNHLATARKSN